MTLIWILISVFAGIAFAMLLYFREKNSAIPGKQRLMLAILRGISVFLIVLLISALMLNRKQKEIEKPIIVILSDNSISVVLQEDSAWFRSDYIDHIQKLENQLEKQTDVFLYEFDNSLKNDISFSFDGQLTDIYQTLDQILQRYDGRNIAGAILISDGIVNSGNDPAILANQLYFPVHTVALGDTTVFADAAIKGIRYNKSAGFGNRFPLEFVIHATGLNGKKSRLIIKQDGKEVLNEEVRYTSDTYSETRTQIFEASRKGLIRLEIILEPLENEGNTANNYATAVIQVLDKKNKVAILYQSPHPDISVFRSALEDAGNYDVELLMSNQFNAAQISAYDAIILYQLPDKRHKNNIPEQVIQSKTPYLIVTGQNTDLRVLNTLQTGFRIQQTSQMTQEALPVFNSSFSLFTISADMQRNLRNFPPLMTHFGNYSLSENYQVLFYQKIGSVQTSNPMIAFSAGGGKTNGLMAGEGLFKWKLFDYMHHSTHSTVNEFILKSMNLLVQQADKRRLRVHHKDVYFTTENAEMTAEVFNMSMEMITTSDVRLFIQNDQRDERELLFSPQISDYKIQLGKLKPGNYTWSANTRLDNELIETNGMFYVENVIVEQLNTRANHNLLQYLSSVSGGKFFRINDINLVGDHILENTELKNIEYVSEQSDLLISLKWILILIVIFLSLEWAARKYLGYY
jgi:hypothetical protein